jgi:hypothetical protein
MAARADEMRSRKTTRITLKARQALVVRSVRGGTETYCADCGVVAPMITPEEAATATGLSHRDLFRRIETGRIHYSETSEGKTLVCLASLTTEMLLAKVT